MERDNWVDQMVKPNVNNAKAQSVERIIQYANNPTLNVSEAFDYMRSELLQFDANSINPDIYNIKVDICNLIPVCRCLGELHIMAAGSMYATIKTDSLDRMQLTNADIPWSKD